MAARAARTEAKKQKQLRAAAAKARAAEARGPKQVAPKRGHRGKQKKIAKKYRGQDAEERRERMAASGNPLLDEGSRPASAAASAVASGASGSGAARAAAPKGPHAFAAQPHHKAGIAPEKPESLLDAGFEGIDALVEKASASLSEDLLHALVMCGPYSAFSQFTYRVKLHPGKERKGRACKAAVSAFVNSVKKEQTARTGEILAAAAKNTAAGEPAAAGAAAANEGGGESEGEGEGATGSSSGPSAGRVKAFFDRQMELVKGLQMAEMVSVMKGEVQLVAIRGSGKGGKKGGGRGGGGKRGGGGRKKGKKGGGKKGKR